MKTSCFISKHAILLISFFFALTLVGQDQSLSKKEQKKKLKEENLQALLNIIKSKSFVIEIDQVVLDGGSIVTVNSNTNFFIIDDSKAFIQLGVVQAAQDDFYGFGSKPSGDSSGINGRGKVDKFELKELKSGKPIIVHGGIIPAAGGNIRFSFTCNSSGLASITFRKQNSNQTVIQGKLYSIEESNIYNPLGNK